MSAETQQIDRDFIEELSQERDEPEWLRERRLKAWESHSDLPNPNVIQTPGRRWTDLSDLDVRSLTRSSTDEDVSRETPSGIPEDVKVMSFEEALTEIPDVLQDYFMDEVVRWDENRYTALHTAGVTSGTVIHVPGGVEIEEPIQISSSVTGDAWFNYTLIIAEDNAKVTVSEEIRGGDESYLSFVVEAAAGDAAEINYGSLQDLDMASYQFTVKRGVAGRDAEVNWIDGCFGSKLTKSTISTVIDGAGASTTNYGVFFGTDSQHFDLETWTDHRAPNSTCDMFTRGVLDDTSVAAYEGTIKVQKEAFDVDAYQTENVLLVSDSAEADASPRLEIDNNDVKCSHAATMGQIDSEELFYLNSRGLDDEAAKQRIIEGFFEPVFGDLPFRGLEDKFREIIQRKMSDSTQ